ncbi:MAG: PEP-CTERM/exosortase system-associated acyltransferase [Rugosibacter sp.]|jgi:N-acyl amino acid synthase of PEP-CTERM/exosortase system|nr:hypothetical protein [Rugosibacter sp.]
MSNNQTVTAGDEMIIRALLGGQNYDLLTPNFKFLHTTFSKTQDVLSLDIMRLRYEVYCNECHFLKATDYPDGYESDEYDDNAYHVAARNEDGRTVATARLVYADVSGKFPFESHCATYDNFVFPDRQSCAEVSRLVVDKGYRRRPGDSMQGVAKDFVEKAKVRDIPFQEDEAKGKHRRHISPQILMGMFRQMYQHSRDNGTYHWFAAMEKGLARSLDRMGFHFTKVGDETDYYGPVAVYYADLRQLSQNLKESNEFLSRWFEGEPIGFWLVLKTWVKFKLESKRKK